MHQKLFKLALSLILVLGLMPSMAFAAPEKDAQSKQSVQEKPLKSATSQESQLKDFSGTWGTSQCEWDDATKTMTISGGTVGQANDAPWKTLNISDKFSIKFESNVKLLEDSSRLFQGNNAELINNIDFSGIDTSDVKNMQYLFSNCEALTTLDLSPFITSKVTNMGFMFEACLSLKSINLSSFDTSQVTHMNYMFSGCWSLISLDFTNFETTALAHNNEMFYQCFSLERVVLGEKVTKLGLLPAYEIKGHTDWYSSAASNWFTSQEINDGRLGTADIYTKEAPKKSIASTVIPNIENVTYTGSEIKPTLHITDGNYALQEGVDYTLSYENNINPGTATVKITGIGKYEGTISKTFTINPKSIAGVSVTGVENRIYTGSAHTQSLHITDGNYALQNGVDYTLSYKNNINPGTATITIKGIGKYTGTITRTFTISSAVTPVKPLIVSEPKSKIKIKRGSSKPVSFSIKAEAVKGGKLSYQWYVNGKAIKGATKATFTIENPATIKPGHYALYCKVMEDIDGRKVSNKSQVSTLTVTRAVSLLQMKSNGKWYLDLKWNKVTNAEGYDVFFSQCNYGKKVFKCKKIATFNSKISYRVKDLEMNTCYKAYVRPFKMVNGKKIYLAKSPQVHAYTTGGKDDIANPTKLVLRQPGGMVRVSKTKQIQAKAYVKNKKKKFISTGHAPVLRYYSDDPSIATVSDTGLITGVSKGTCKIYVVTQNGISQRYSVRVR